MSRSKPPRRKYKPRPVYANAVETAMAGAARVPAQVADSYTGPLGELIARIKTGDEDLGEWTRIRDASLICEALMETGAAKMPAHERERIVLPWLDAIESAVARRRAGPRDGLTGPERTALDSLLTWYSALLAEATQEQLLTAQRHALRRVRSALGEINKAVRAAGLPECGLSRELANVAELEAIARQAEISGRAA